ncbi:macro domain-like protein [Auriscalpium vulgare]|uniref:Macro domain-like protein n=1 Tax=Auriscalpium vulgare TaxID=40419 RepID=A0ACB8RFG2_9AGAM|nr:macro domain-like protein [Auriscalpium vulgare]
MSFPQFLLISSSTHKPTLYERWQQAIQDHYDGDAHPFTLLQGRFGELPAEETKCDCIVSPANSFGIMDGGFDMMLSEVFGGKPGDIYALTNHCQAYIRETWNGFIPPGSCSIVSLPSSVAGPSNQWGTRTIAILPTMRTPQDVSWHRDLVYNCMWSLLVALQRWNEAHGPAERIRSVLMTGLATGTGGIVADVCAQQMVLAVKHFQQGLPDHPRWPDVLPRSREVDRTTEPH